MNNHSNKVLILSQHFDYHAASVQWGLEQMGVSSDYLCINDFTSMQTISAYPSRKYSMSISGIDFEAKTTDYRTIWLRRGLNPVISDEVSSLDAHYALREAKTLISGVLEYLSQTSFAVNRFDVKQKYSNKVNQLFLAKKIGFHVPDTIVSNSPSEIRDFYREHNGEIIFKPLSFVNWIDTGRSAGIYTSRVSAEDLQDDGALRACPGIFQPEVNKKYELRVTVMGESIFAVKFNTQESGKSLDWRVDFRGNPPCEQYRLPVSVEVKILNFMSASGLVFGCFDFILNTDNEYVFIEVNEMGQFLWLDFAIPELHQFDSFCNFLAEARSDFRYKPSSNALTVQEFDKHYQANKKMYDERGLRHVNGKKSFAIMETLEISKDLLR